MSTDFSSFYGIYSASCRRPEPFRQVEEDILQETAGDPTPRPQQNLHCSPYDDTTSVATNNQVIYRADPTSNNDSRVPHHGLSDAGLSPSGYLGLPLSVYQGVTQYDMERDVAGLQSHFGNPPANDPDSSDSESWFMRIVQEFQLQKVYAGDRTTNDYPQTPRDDPRDDTLRSSPSVYQGIIQRGTRSAEESPPNSIPSTVFHNTFPGSFSHPEPGTPQGGTTPGVAQHQAIFPTTYDHPVSATDQVPVSPTGGRRPIPACGWDDGGGPCGINVCKDRIAEHMKSLHVKPRLSSDSAVKCQWKGCQKTLRRDTIFRHILEKHYRIRRSESRRGRAMSH